jgi:hypothetical protein
MTSSPIKSPANPPPPCTLAAPDCRLRVVFRWQHDRFVHSLWWDDREIGHSVESDGDESWPVSPPLQQLSLEEIDGRLVALGVGAAGQSHWSISVEPYLAPDGATGWKFDLACRCQASPGRLASTYRLDEPLDLQPLADSTRQMTDAGLAICPGDSTGQLTQRWSYSITNR